MIPDGKKLPKEAHSPTEPQILHAANSEALSSQPPAESSPQSPGQEVGDPVKRRIAELLDQLAKGLQWDEQMEFDRLTLARNFGPYVLELKSIVPHGEYMDRLKERFPKSSYYTCHRWRFLAERDDEIEVAIKMYPDVQWGPTKMIAYLKGRWSPGTADEEEDINSLVGAPVEQGQQNEEASESVQTDVAGEGEESDSDGEQVHEPQAKESPNSNKKYKKLMDRFGKGGDMHKGGSAAKKSAQPPGYRMTVVTPEKGDLDKFGALLPSPTIDFKAHSVSGWVRAQDIGSTLASVGSTLTASSLKKVRVVVEL